MNVAFWLLAWVFAIQHDGKVQNGGVAFDTPMTQEQCLGRARELAEKNPLEQFKKSKKDKPLYSRFICVPVPMPPKAKGTDV